MTEHFRALAESAARSPDRPLSRLPMLSEAERRKVARRPGTSARRAAAGARVDQGAVRGAGRRVRPTRPRSSFDGERADLRRAEPPRQPHRVAAARAAASGPGTFVGILMEKSLDLVPAVLGVVKSGGAYIPLDPLYPPDRIEFMVADAQPQVLLTQEQALEARARRRRRRRASRSTPRARSTASPTRTRRHGRGGDDLAYVIYTSGSTGQPKGAMIAQPQPRERLLRLRARVPAARADGARADGELLVRRLHRRPDPLAARRREARAVPDRDRRRPGRALRADARARGSTRPSSCPPPRRCCSSTSSARARRSTSCDWSSSPARRGATRSTRSSRALCGPSTRLINSYGLTEATIDSTWFEPGDDAELVPGRFVPIGGPLDNTRVYVLDSELEPQPIGIPGELCVGGVAVARGYLNRPELTAERFVPDPFSDEPGALLYRTGDLARWLPGRDDRLPRPHRPPDQDPRLPDRAGRDRGRARAASRDPRGRRRRPRRRPRRDAAGRPISTLARRLRDAGRPARVPRRARPRTT